MTSLFPTATLEIEILGAIFHRFQRSIGFVDETRPSKDNPRQRSFFIK